jgi:hypothetical protein
MSETTPDHDEAQVHDEPHAAGDGGADTEHDDHGHAGEALGPIDWPQWAAGILGVAIGIVIAAGFALSTGAVGGA